MRPVPRRPLLPRLLLSALLAPLLSGCQVCGDFTEIIDLYEIYLVLDNGGGHCCHHHCR